MVCFSTKKIRKLPLLMGFLFESIIQLLIYHIGSTMGLPLIIVIIATSKILAILFHIIYRKYIHKDNPNTEIDLTFNNNEQNTSLGKTIFVYFLMFLCSLFTLSGYITYYFSRSIGLYPFINLIFLECGIKIILPLLHIPFLVFLFKNKLYIHNYIGFIFIFLGIILSITFYYIGKTELSINTEYITNLVSTSSMYVISTLFGQTLQKYLLEKKKQKEIILVIIEAILSIIIAGIGIILYHSKYTNVWDNFIANASSAISMVIISILLGIQYLINTSTVKNISPLPLFIIESIIYFIVVIVKQIDGIYESSVIFNGKVYFIISLFLIFIGSLIINEILIIPFCGLDLNTAVKLEEEKKEDNVNLDTMKSQRLYQEEDENNQLKINDNNS